MTLQDVNWRQIFHSSGILPSPRHGHRAVAVKDSILMFGGGKDGMGIQNDLFLYNTLTNHWTNPAVKGDIPPGRAAYGIATEGSKVFIHGGMVEYGGYSRDLYQLDTNIWEWKLLKPRAGKNGSVPSPRIGHTFTIINSIAYLFGGLENRSEDPKNSIPRYLNDLWRLQIRSIGNLQWEMPQTYGTCPPPRESHSTVVMKGKDGNANKLIVFGGMNGLRLNDLWILNIESMTWNNPRMNGPVPLPRSLHSATMIGNKMFVFGGWIPLPKSSEQVVDPTSKWKCTNDLIIFDMNLLRSYSPNFVGKEPLQPKNRAGHCAVNVQGRIWIWSGRDGYREVWNSFVCHNDLWYLEVDQPKPPEQVQLVCATTRSFEICWRMTPREETYILQIQKVPNPKKTEDQPQTK